MVILFGIGIERVMLTERAAKTFSSPELHIALFRHSNCDWGNLPAEEIKLNQEALKGGKRVISVYNNMVVITEFGNCNITTIAFADEID